MPEGRTQRLQQAAAAFILEADEAALEADPARVSRRLGLSPADQQSFTQQLPAWLTYRELARMSLLEPLETMFPVLRALLGPEDWVICTQAFLDARLVRSPHYRDIAPAFLGWLAENRWGQARWPFLLELAHAEVLEVLVARYPDSELPGGLKEEPDADFFLAWNAATQVVSYTHAVHRASEANPIPEARPTQLLAYRDAEGDVFLMELTSATASLLVQARTIPVDEAAAALGLADLEPVLTLLRDLRQKGALDGFSPIPLT